MGAVCAASCARVCSCLRSSFEAGTTAVLPFDVDGDSQRFDKIAVLSQEEGADVTVLWQADAWAETILDKAAFVTSVAYEMLPPFISGLVCWCLEGKASANNRGLLPTEAKRFLPQAMMTLPAYIMVLVWLIAWPEDVKGLEICFPFIMMAWRGVCIAMKYAYFSPSDLARVRSPHWLRTGHTNRVLGLHKYFNAAGTLAFDRLENLFKTAVRVGLLKETRETYLTVLPEVGAEVWHRVRPELVPENIDALHTKHVPGAKCWRSKYGDVQRLLGLDDLKVMDAMVAQGRLPVSAVAYYFIQEAGDIRGKRCISFVILLLGSALTFLHPVALHIAGRPPFGETLAGHVIMGIRVVSLSLLFLPVFLYLAFPLLDGFQRDHMSLALLSAFGRGEARADLLVKRGADGPLFQIGSLMDLRAFYCLCRLLGPNYEIGTLYRYNSAFMTVHVLFMCGATGALVASSWQGDIMWGVIAELCMLFASGAIAVMSASLVCVLVNAHLPMYCGVARQAALRDPELGGVAKDICSSLKEEHALLNPVKILYMPATPALLSLVWSGIVLLGTLFVAGMPNVCVPIFVFGRGCKD